MKRFLLPLLLLLPSLVFAQGGKLTQNPWVSNRQGFPAGGTSIAVCQPLATTAASLTSTVATFTMASNPITAGFVNGMTVQIAGYTGADTYFNKGTLAGGSLTGGVPIILVTATQIIAGPIAHADGIATTNGTLLQVGNTVTSCAGMSTIYTDASLVTTTANPITADGLGNYEAGAVPGVYYVQYYGSGITTTMRQITVYCVNAMVASCGPGGGGGGTISGTIANGQIAVGSGINTVSGSANLTYISNLFKQQDSACVLTAIATQTLCGTGLGATFLSSAGLQEVIQHGTPWGTVWTNDAGTGNSGVARGTFLGMFTGVGPNNISGLSFIKSGAFQSGISFGGSGSPPAGTSEVLDFNADGSTEYGINNTDATTTEINFEPNGGADLFYETGFGLTSHGPITDTALTQNSVIYAGVNGLLTGVTPPTVNGTYGCIYNVTSSVSVPLTCPQVGIADQTINGVTAGYTVLFSDTIGYPIVHDIAGSSAVTVSLPTPTTLKNPQAVVVYENRSAQTDTITPAVWTIQSNTTAAGASVTIAPGTRTIITIDPFNATNWLATTYSLTGSVNAVQKNTANTATSAFTLDMSAAGDNTIQLPNGACITGNATSSNYLAVHEAGSNELCMRLGSFSATMAVAGANAVSTTCTNQVVITISGALPPTCAASPAAGINNFVQAAQSQTVVSGTEYYLTKSDLDMPATYHTAIGAGTTMFWHVAINKTAAGTGTFQVLLKKGTNGSIADTSIVTQTIGTQTAAVDNMVLDISLTWTSATAAYWSIIPRQLAASGTGFGLVYPAVAADFSGTISGQTTTTASDKYGLSVIFTTGTPTFVVSQIKGEAFNVN